MQNSWLSVLLGLFAVAGLNYLTTPTEAQRGGGPLMAVAHNTTLSGAGTTESPLSIADGGVGANQIGAGTAPTLGQFLGFDGTGLTWQTPPSGGGALKLVDSRGEFIGFGYPDSSTPDPYFNFVRVVNGIGLRFSAYATGFAGSRSRTFSQPPLRFESADCSGTGYLSEHASGGETESFFIPDEYGFVEGTTELIFSARNVRNRRILSLYDEQGFCSPTDEHDTVEEAIRLDVSDFVPPFRLSH